MNDVQALEAAASLQQLETARDLTELRSARRAVGKSLRAIGIDVRPRAFIGDPTRHDDRMALAAAFRAHGVKRMPLLLREYHHAVHDLGSAMQAMKTLFPGSASSAIEKAFERMEIAEREIAEARREHPEKSGLLWNQFMLLSPSPILQDAPMAVYSWHAWELLDRVVKKHPVDLATKAEIMMHLANASVKVKPRRKYAMVYHKLFRQLFPSQYNKMFDSLPEQDRTVPSEEWPHQYLETLSELQRTFRVPQRHVIMKNALPEKELKQEQPASKKTDRSQKSLLDFFK